MPATLEAGTIEGYCVGEPWNQAAVFKKIGVPVVTDDQIQRLNPEKVLGLRKDFADKYPNTTKALLRAIIRAQIWLDADNGKNRPERSEEHTSELQSLMRNSYAVFCLKKKKYTQNKLKHERT